MGNFWLKLKIWTKLILVLLVVIYVVMFAVKNAGPTATLWLFIGDDPPRQVPVLQLVLIAFASGVVVTILARTTLRTINQIKDLKARQAAEKRDREIEELKSKAGMLRPRHERQAEGEAPQPKAE